MHEPLCRLSHEMYELLLQLDEHIPTADDKGKRLMYEAKEKIKDISRAAQQA